MRKFLGMADARRISLYRLFPRGKIVFSTPFAESGKIHQLVVEGQQPQLDALAEHLRQVTMKEYIEERGFGRWYGFGPHETTGGYIVYYDTLENVVNTYQLLVFVLRRHLVKLCDLRLVQVSHVLGILDGKEVVKEQVQLTPDIGNGTIELPDLPPPPPGGMIIH